MRKRVQILNLTGNIWLVFAAFLVSLLAQVKDAQGQYKDTIYIDPSYTGEVNNGSFENPFRSLKNITVWQDSVFYAQKRGTKDTMSGNFNIRRKSWIKIGVYGEGTDYAHLHNSAIGNFKTFNLTACYRTIIDNFHITGSYKTVTAVYITDDSENSTFPGDGNKVTNCFIEKYEWGIRIIKFNTSPFDTVTIERTKVHDIADDGIFVQGWFQPLRGLDINECYIDSVNMNYWIKGQAGPLDAAGDGIQISRLVDGLKIRNTVVDRRNSSNKFCIIVNDDSGSKTCSGTIENCTLYAPDLGTGGVGCYFENLKFMTFINNKVFCNEKSWCISTKVFNPLLCAYNTFSRMQSGGTTLVFDLSSGPNYIYNNTIYGADKVIHSIGFPSYVYNNIFAYAGIVYDGNVLTSPDNNLFFNSTPGNFEPNSVYNEDPLFVNASAGDFRLRTGSPAIDRGRDLGYTRDIAGTSVPQGAGVEIGAYEYVPTETTSPNPPPHSFHAKNITYTSFTLYWKSSRDRSGITGYNVYVNGSFYAFVKDNSVNITDLTQNTRYVITVEAKDGNGNISKAGKTFVTTKRSSDNKVPSAPTGLSATDIGQTKFTLSWNASVDNVGVTEYQIFRDGELYNSVSGTSATVTGAAGTFYTIYVKAKDAVGNTSAASDTLTVLTLAQCSGSVPFTNSGFDVQTGTFIAEMDVVPGGDGMDGIIGLSDGPATGFGNLACIVRFTTNGMADARNSGVYAAVNPFPYQAGTSYHVKMVVNVATKLYDVYIRKTSETAETILASQYGFRAQATKLNNLCLQAGACRLTINNFSVSPVSDTEVPAAPTGLSYNNLSSYGLTLSWAASADNTGVTGYDIFRNGVFYKSVTGTSVEITGLASATTYSFAVKAKDMAANVSQLSEAISVTTLVDTEAPSVPSGLDASDISETSFVLMWNPSTDNVGVTGYDVYIDGNLAASVTQTYAFIYGLTKATVYSLTVKAKDAAGNISESSSVLKVRTSGMCSDFSSFVNNLEEDLEAYSESENSLLSKISALKVQVYPNPASRVVTIETSEHAELKIIDTKGTLLFNKSIEAGFNEISLNLKSGIYIVRVFSSNSEIYFGKLIVK